MELNQLAIVNLVGTDVNPNTGNLVVYYQIANPTAISRSNGSGIKSTVYTYRVEAPSFAELPLTLAQGMPRELFPDHFQAYLITERYATQGLNNYLNFIERQSNRRTDLDLIVTDSPLSKVMNTYTLFDRLPGSSLRSMLEVQSKISGSVNKKTRINDVLENMESLILTVLPIISLQDSKAASTTERFEQIDATRSNLRLTGGAIMRKDRMIGRLNLKQLEFYNLLNGDANLINDTVSVHSNKVDLRASNIKVHSELSLVSGIPVWNLNIHANLQIVFIDKPGKLTLTNLSEIKEAFNSQTREKGIDFYKLAVSNHWDLFSIEEQMKKKRGREWMDMMKDEDAWRNTKLNINVTSKITDIGGIIDPYTKTN